MKIYVKAKPRSKFSKIEKIDGTHLIVSVKEPPVLGQANRAIIKALSDYLDIPVSQIEIIKGLTSKEKIIETY